MNKCWVYTNPETLETYRFRKLENGVIQTVCFLGYRASNGKIIKPTCRSKPKNN